jgi:hypothetical protein
LQIDICFEIDFLLTYLVLMFEVEYSFEIQMCMNTYSFKHPQFILQLRPADSMERSACLWPSPYQINILLGFKVTRLFIISASALVFSLIGCGKPEPPPPSPQLAEVTKERDRERAARIEAEAARHKAESHNTSLMFGAALGCAVALFAGVALGCSARRRSSPSNRLQRGQPNE